MRGKVFGIVLLTIMLVTKTTVYNVFHLVKIGSVLSVRHHPFVIVHSATQTKTIRTT
jgi:hypothetical protein